MFFYGWSYTDVLQGTSFSFIVVTGEDSSSFLVSMGITEGQSFNMKSDG